MQSARTVWALLVVAAASFAASGCWRANPDAVHDAGPIVLLDSGYDDAPDGGAGDLAAPPDLTPPPSCPTAPLPDPHRSERAACAFAAGARVADTLGLTADARKHLPLEHLIIVTQENRSFDHFFGRLPVAGQPDADGWPATFTNPDANNASVAPYHLTTNTLPLDPPHQSAAMQSGWDSGHMDGFVRSAASASNDGHFVMGYYDNTDLPFLYWLANNFAIADRYFAPALGGTWANRDYLYAATSDGILDTGERTLTKPTIFDALDAAHVVWGVYSDGTPRQDCLGWTAGHTGVRNFAAFLTALNAGNLPTVSFVDPSGCQDEHPTNDVHGGENWLRTIYEAAVKSPEWPSLALIITFDEAGGLADHVAPPAACPPSADQATFNNYGVRIPAIVISPYARPHFVSHAVHDHTSILRLIEGLEDIPALTARDANADALFDLFDFACPSLASPPVAPAAGAAVCL
jgi:phospholipase C